VVEKPRLSATFQQLFNLPHSVPLPAIIYYFRLVQQYLTIWDLVLTPIYLILLGYFAMRHRDKNYPSGHPLHTYYLPGLWVKFGGVLFIALVYQYYYGGGDTFNYFKYANIVNSSLSDSLTTWVKLIFRVSVAEDYTLYPYASQIEFYSDPASYAIVSITAILGLLTFNTYIPCGLLFAYLSFTGIWAMYRTFYAAYPHLSKQLAIAFLFVPSVFVWGSSVFKDTVCMFGLGWLTYTTFRIFVHRDFSIKNLFLLVLSFYLVGIIKVYILLAFLPSLALWLLLTYSYKIKNGAVRFFIKIAAIGVVILGFVFFSSQFSKELNKYSVDKLAETLETTRGWIIYASGDEGSAYDIGEFEPTLTGIITKFPAGVTVTLYRPFLWEVKKLIQLLSSLEGLLFMVLTILVFYRNGLFKTFQKIFSNPNLVFFFTFSMIFAFAVGVSSGNFGALSRYKIPCLPFFAALLFILHHSSKKPTPTQQTRTTQAGYPESMLSR
jgi:hypothetical protein